MWKGKISLFLVRLKLIQTEMETTTSISSTTENSNTLCLIGAVFCVMIGVATILVYLWIVVCITVTERLHTTSNYFLADALELDYLNWEKVEFPNHGSRNSRVYGTFSEADEPAKDDSLSPVFSCKLSSASSPKPLCVWLCKRKPIVVSLGQDRWEKESHGCPGYLWIWNLWGSL